MKFHKEIHPQVPLVFLADKVIKSDMIILEKHFNIFAIADN